MEKESKIPEIPYTKPLHRVEGPPKEARASFYELAKKRIKYLTNEEFMEWDPERTSPAFLMVTPKSRVEQGKLEKWIDDLEIIVNKDAFKIKDKDYSDLIPFVAEHEIYEAWLKVKKGAGSELERKKKHLLAQRRAFFLAEQKGKGLGNKLLKWSKLIAPNNINNNIKHIKECEYALKVAKKQLGHLKR